MTTTLLIKDLIDAKNDHIDLIDQIDALIISARYGAFHDFESCDATPKITLVNELKKLNLHILVDNVVDGKYDDDL